jgi:hypothetical protein
MMAPLQLRMPVKLLRSLKAEAERQGFSLTGVADKALRCMWLEDKPKNRNSQVKTK